MVDYAMRLLDLTSPPGNRLEALRATARASIQSVSTTSGGSAFAGQRPDRRTSRLRTITDKENTLCLASAPILVKSCASAGIGRFKPVLLGEIQTGADDERRRRRRQRYCRQYQCSRPWLRPLRASAWHLTTPKWWRSAASSCAPFSIQIPIV